MLLLCFKNIFPACKWVIILLYNSIRCQNTARCSSSFCSLLHNHTVLSASSTFVITSLFLPRPTLYLVLKGDLGIEDAPFEQVLWQGWKETIALPTHIDPAEHITSSGAWPSERATSHCFQISVSRSARWDDHSLHPERGVRRTWECAEVFWWKRCESLESYPKFQSGWKRKEGIGQRQKRGCVGEMEESSTKS